MMTKYQIKQDQQQTIKITESGDYLIELIGQGAVANIVGGFLADKTQKIDVNIIIHHKAKNTLANTTLKGVAKDNSSVRFYGKIVIDKDCGSSNSFLTERILLLSEKASTQAIPELEILTDDVKCSHAASVSYIPPQQVFYLMSRGIPREQAETLISDGFLEI